MDDFSYLRLSVDFHEDFVLCKKLIDDYEADKMT